MKLDERFRSRSWTQSRLPKEVMFASQLTQWYVQLLWLQSGQRAQRQSLCLLAFGAQGLQHMHRETSHYAAIVSLTYRADCSITQMSGSSVTK